MREPQTFQAQDPYTGELIDRFAEAHAASVTAAAAAAGEAVPALTHNRTRARLLRAIAERLRKAGAAIHPAAARETGLPQARLSAELERTCVQLELHADVAEEGSLAQAIVDLADPDAKIAPRPDLRRMLMPLGPVGVFGASNFPYAFGVAGGDTASALAAGCPVVVKGHPSHPRTCELIAECVSGAVGELGLPDGVFTLVQGATPQTGALLVQAPEIAAVGFTGSLAGGRALMDLAAARPRPIPVYAEMGSVNPTVVTPAALRARAQEIAGGLAASVTMGTGQFCTKPGVVLVPQEDHGFADLLAQALDALPAGTLLNASIDRALAAGLDELDANTDVTRLTAARAPEERPAFCGVPSAFVVDASTAVRRPELLEERFGPVVLLVRYRDQAELSAVLGALGGQLTTTVHAEPEDTAEIGALTETLARLSGRVVFNGFPTGVAVTHAMTHGGPYPASSLPFTSVGTTAVRRFQRPVSFQDTPGDLLPAELRDENPLGIWRLVNGELTRAPIALG